MLNTSFKKKEDYKHMCLMEVQYVIAASGSESHEAVAYDYIGF